MDDEQIHEELENIEFLLVRDNLALKDINKAKEIFNKIIESVQTI